MLLPRYSYLIPTLVVLSYGVYQATCLDTTTLLGDEQENEEELYPRIIVKLDYKGKSSLRKCSGGKKPRKHVTFTLPIEDSEDEQEFIALGRRHSTSSVVAMESRLLY
ncbi:hypothetical protein THRCLA_20327 [Thraustotheca clavata]|uniref:Uncharacterized protein n=1 Tax=Thraustotheca clavata TaxID=74557 RepID=A0A1W0A9F6_9STRA|nr:hypothetical protein THRCLA_20327 [Thraustotheca clavata]